MFTVQPEEIERLDGGQLVELLRVLVHAEARSSGVPLRSVDVPLQITIPDGGQDGSVKWEDGEASTPYLPFRDVIFQSKATDHGDSQWRKEVWTKKTQPKKALVKELNPAIAGALTRGAAYIGVTGSCRVNEKIADREQAIRDAIAQAGGDPTQLASIQVYDGNKLAAWANAHPAVALWVREREAGFSLAAFHTLQRWGRRTGLTAPQFVQCDDREFSLGPNPDDRLKFHQLGKRILDYLTEPNACVRVWGASGLGKTRALHEAITGATGVLLDVSNANLIFCDFRESATHVFDVAHQLNASRSDAILVVDSCPWEEAKLLFDLAREDGSLLRVVTLGVEGRDRSDDCLMVRPLPTDEATISGILTNALPQVPAEQIEYLAAQCAGYPEIAVLASSAYAKDKSIRKSVNEIGERILKAAGAADDTVRALECLALFESLAPDRDPRGFDALCETLVHMKGELVFEHLVRASEQHLVERNQDLMTMPMLPTANFLALRRLRYLRPSTLTEFLQGASAERRDAMLARWKALGERSATVIEVIRTMVRRGWLRDDKILDSGAIPYLVAFVHADPDTMLQSLSFAIHSKPINELAALDVNGAVLEALGLLASLPRTFSHTVPLVLRLAAASDLDAETPVVRLLRQLYQVALAGTGADEKARRNALSLALEDDDPRLKRACVEALGAMLTTRMTRFGDYERVGDEPFHPEWHPTDHEQILGYFRWSLERLLAIWRKHPDLRARIEDIVAGDLRMLVEFDVLPLIEDFVREVVAARGHWFEGTRGIGDWLYYDRPAEEDDHAKAIRALYDLTLPTDPVDQVLLCSRFWSTDIHDPDTRYADNSDNPDFDYPTRRVQALAPAIAVDPDLRDRAIAVMASTETNTPFPFAQALVDNLDDPLAAFAKAVEVLDRSVGGLGIGFVRALLNSIDRRFADDKGRADQLVAMARGSSVLAADEMAIYTALAMTDERVVEIAAAVRDGKFDVHRVVPISYGRGLDHVPAPILAELIEALVGRTEDRGAWAAVEILNMVVHGKKQVSPEILELIKQAVLAPEIAEGPTGHIPHAEHALERLIKLLGSAKAIDDVFARGFALLIERACRSVGAQLRPTDALRKALGIVVRAAPLETWTVLSGFYEVATRAERERLGRMIAASRPFAFDGVRTGAGLLFEAPEPVLVDWVEKGPDERLAFLFSFYPILVQQDEIWAWHPALQRLADRFGGSAAFRKGVRSRILPSSYAGSLEAHLRSFQAPLAAWDAHPILSEWSERLRADLERWLEHEAERF